MHTQRKVSIATFKSPAPVFSLFSFVKKVRMKSLDPKNLCVQPPCKGQHRVDRSGHRMPLKHVSSWLPIRPPFTREAGMKEGTSPTLNITEKKRIPPSPLPWVTCETSCIWTHQSGDLHTAEQNATKPSSKMWRMTKRSVFLSAVLFGRTKRGNTKPCALQKYICPTWCYARYIWQKKKKEEGGAF